MGELLGVYLFGSVARGEGDQRSDLDLLAVVADGKGKVSERTVYEYVPAEFSGLDVSISWYGRQRLRTMYENGELFGWHLYQEARPLFEVEPALVMLGIPNPYRDAAADVASFEKVLAVIPEQLSASPLNAVYELGLVYVCLRNICMAASSELCGRPDFSRHSPFKLPDFPSVPMELAEYDLAMTCRMAGQRGLLPPSSVSVELVADIHSRLMPWVAMLRQCLEGK